MEEEIENLNSQNEEEITTPEESEPEVGLPPDPIEVEPKDEQAEEAEVLKQRNQELYEQLKKAKGFERDKKTGKWVQKSTPKVVEKETTMPGDITRTELYSLVKANVPDEDTQEVITYARSHNMTATEALKTPELKAILSVRKEYRASEEATNVSATRRGPIKLTPEQILTEAEQGKLPEDPAQLVEARMQAKLKK